LKALLKKAHKKRVSLLHRAATTNYPCCDQALGGSLGAGRVGLTPFDKDTSFLFKSKKLKSFLFQTI